MLKQEKSRAEQEARAEVESVKREYARKEELLADERAEAQRRTREAESLKQSIKADTQKQAKEMVKAKVKSLEASYQAKTSSHYAYVTGVSLYAVLVTLFTAIRSEAFVSDFKAFFGTIWAFLLTALEKLLQLAKWASQIGDKIPQEIVAFIVHWLVLIAVVVLVGGGAILLLFIGVEWVYQNYKSDYADTTSLAVALASLAISVFFAEPIRAVIPINLLLLLIITHVLYVGVRWFIKGYRESRGYW